VQIHRLKALVSISSNYFPVVKEGMKAAVSTELYPQLNFSGVISRVYPTIDNLTKTFIVEIVIDNEQLKLRPGMFSKIKLQLGKGNALLVPNIAVGKQTGTNNMYVFIHKDGIANKVNVKTGRMINDNLEILDGLKDGDEVIIVGQNKLEHNVAVKVVQ